MPAASKEVVIVNRRGLHARAAARLVKLAAQFGTELEICRGSICVPATSILGLMTLGATQGTSIMIQGNGDDVRQAVEAIANLVGRGFDEEIS